MSRQRSTAEDPFRVVIAGGGITGLSAAYFARKYASEAGLGAHIRLLEAEERLGGHIVSTRRDGFLIEGGPDCFLSRKTGGMELVRELGLEGQLMGTESRNARTYVVSDDTLHPLPEGTMLMIPTKVLPVAASRLLSWKGKLRMGLDLMLPRRAESEEESLGAFVRRRLGNEALRKIAEPLVAGVHAGDPDLLSLASTFPRFKAMEDEERSLILAVLKARRKAKAKSSSAGGSSAPSGFVTLQEGLEGLTRGLCSALDEQDTVETGKRVTAVAPSIRPSGGYAVRVESGKGVEQVEADAVILALPAPQAADAVREMDGALAHELGGISFNSAATVTLGYRREQVGVDMRGHGFVVSRREQRSVMGVTWSSSKFRGRAPEGRVSVRAFLGGTRDPELNFRQDEELAEMVIRDVGDVLKVQGEPVVQEIYRWPFAMPQYEIGHAARMERVAARLSSWRGLTVAGSSYHGIGIPDCASDGKRSARETVLGSV